MVSNNPAFKIIFQTNKEEISSFNPVVVVVVVVVEHDFDTLRMSGMISLGKDNSMSLETAACRTFSRSSFTAQSNSHRTSRFEGTTCVPPCNKSQPITSLFSSFLFFFLLW
jgi:hypothetical protein